MVNISIVLLITLSMYNNIPRQTDDTPNQTAFHREYGPNKHTCLVHQCGIAVDRLLEDSGFKHGCKVRISDITGVRLDKNGTDYCRGIYVVNDRMHWRKKWQADIFDFSYERAINFGVQKGTIQLLGCDEDKN